MKPTAFPEANVELQAPQGMANCDPMWVFRDGTYCISKWRFTWLERLQLLFQGHLWVWVCSGMTQPPIALTVEQPFHERS